MERSDYAPTGARARLRGAKIAEASARQLRA
jgi:hypothetical protein